MLAERSLAEVFGKREAAQYLDVSERQLDRWIRGGKIAATKLGRLVRIRREELERVAREGIPA